MSQQINLFNPEFLTQKKIFTSHAMLLALGVLVAGALALVMVGRHTVAVLEAEAAAGAEQLALKKERQARVMTEFAPRQKSKELDNQIASAQAELASLHQVSAVLNGKTMSDARKGYSRFFKALARQSTGELWLTGVRIGGVQSQIALQGRALDANLVPAYVSRLTREPAMQGKSFSSLQISRARLQVDGKESEDPSRLAPYIDFTLQDVTAERAAVSAGAVFAAPTAPSEMTQVADRIKAEVAK
ncbi:hypothetical protein IV454_22120 [Massilia antarctica]|uniref:MSHA biogenesis protein MshI n=1 Tax=Massilia antarctica TaxID=2765360 RepID=A0AA48WAN8_9BURK|nr:PilN domain-containing protein [Massilia antarctica]QPI48223.1 hypothetical protein IV454_22120 [Massilia antarctica]